MGTEESAEDPVVILRAEVARLREEIKEREPNFLGALKTFLKDSQSWRAGEREFPQAAAVGLAFAYLRPRVILAVGSIAAVIIAVAQIWLIHGQNEIMAEQGRLFRAQTVVAIVQELREQDPLAHSTVALVEALGAVGHDVAATIAIHGPNVSLQENRPPYSDLYAWMNAAQIIANNASGLSAGDAFMFNRQLLRQHLNVRISWERTQNAIKQALGAAGTGFPVDLDRRRSELSLYMQKLSAIVRTLHRNRPLDAQDYDQLTLEGKEKLLKAIVSFYTPRTHVISSQGDIDRELSSICRGLGHKKLTEGLQAHLQRGLEQIQSKSGLPEDISTQSLVMFWCGLAGEKSHDDWNQWVYYASYTDEPE